MNTGSQNSGKADRPMSDPLVGPEDVIRRELADYYSDYDEVAMQTEPNGLAALDTLLRERDELTRADPLKARYIEMMRREIAAVAERDQLREALRYIAGDHLEHRNNDECLADCQRVASAASSSEGRKDGSMTCSTCVRPGITDPRYEGWVFDSYEPYSFGGPFGPVVVFRPCPVCGTQMNPRRAEES